jgi:hypothetical protein
LLSSFFLSVLSIRGAVAADPSVPLLVAESDHETSSFKLPQTNFVYGKVGYDFKVNRGNNNNQPYHLDGTLFGFDLEVNQSEWINIGAFARFNFASAPRPDPIDGEMQYFSSILGGFVRAFYSPEFLSSRTTATNVFGQIRLGAGSSFLTEEFGGYGAVLAQAGVHFGVETYFTRWFGLGLSFGRTYDWGIVTAKGHGAPPANFFGQGSEVVLSLKTTLF